MSNNVGTASPYLENLTILYEPSADYPNLRMSFDDSPMYVDGQRVTATMDGMSVSLSMAVNALHSGSARVDPFGPALSGQLASLFGVIAVYNGDGPGSVDLANRIVTTQAGTTSYIMVGLPGTSFGFGMPPIRPPGTGGGGGGGDDTDETNTGDKAKFSKEKFNECVKKLGVTGDYAFNRSVGGSFVGTYYDSSSIEAGSKSISVNTSIERHSRALAGDLNKATGDNWKNQSGITLRNSPGLNWIASNVANGAEYSDVGVLALWVHELGNALAVQMEISKPFSGYAEENARVGVTDDADFGQTLETCVFGGRVGLRSGRLGSSRELYPPPSRRRR
jgi:hypothetical protein